MFTLKTISLQAFFYKKSRLSPVIEICKDKKTSLKYELFLQIHTSLHNPYKEFGQTITLLSLQVLALQLTFVKNQMVVLSLGAF